MPTLDIIKVSGLTPPELDVIRVLGAGLLATEFHLDIIKVSGTGALELPNPNLDIIKVSGIGEIALLLDEIPDYGDQEPGDLVVITAVLRGAVADSYTWRQISGFPIELDPDGASVSVRLPGSDEGTVLVLGVIAHVGARDTAEERVAISVHPTTFTVNDEPAGLFVDR